MASIIIAGNNASLSTIKTAIAAVNKSAASQKILIAPDATETRASGIRFISSSGKTMGESLLEALSFCATERTVVLNLIAELSEARLLALLNMIEKTEGDSFGYAPIEQAGELIDLPEMTIEVMFQQLTSGERLPLLCCSAVTSILKDDKLRQAETTLEYLAGALCFSTAAGIRNVSVGDAVSLPLTFNETSLVLSSRETARTLRLILDSCNIEDLFPGHPWLLHQGESAAASYHCLAAMFIRHGDYEAANSCLSLSDTFEDSPRSLALKGLIARERGEVLGAVANLISSLQQYELRKRNNNGEHYLTFIPGNLEVLNSNMREGLSALNKRDNGAALSCFMEAVANFDPFYREFGIE